MARFSVVARWNFDSFGKIRNGQKRLYRVYIIDTLGGALKRGFRHLVLRVCHFHKGIGVRQKAAL